MEPDYMVIELKYCEGCGGLYLREPGQDLPYCTHCHEKFAHIALAGKPEGREA